MSEEKQIPDIRSSEWTEIAREIRELKAQLAAVTKERDELADLQAEIAMLRDDLAKWENHYPCFYYNAALKEKP